MKKRIISFLIAFALLLSNACMLLSVSVKATEVRLYDNAALLDADENQKLQTKLNEISERQNFDIIIVTVDSLDGKTPRDYADDFYDENNFGYGNNKDGVLLLISMENRDWYISTCGYGIEAITDAGREYMSECFLSDLSDGDYAEAFETYADMCDDYVTEARKGTPYDVNHMPDKGFNPMTIVIGLAVGVIGGVIVVLVLRGQLKTVRLQRAASNYIVNGSLQMEREKDMYLYSNVVKTAKPKENNSGGSSTHESSSGTTHGGGGGSF